MKQRSVLLILSGALGLLLTGCSTPTSTPTPAQIAALLAETTAAAQQGVAAYTNILGMIAAVQAAQAVPPSTAVSGTTPAVDCTDGSCSDRGADNLIPAAAVIVGLTRVDPHAYNGWSGSCPGCDVDAAVFADACHQEGVPFTLLLNDRANRSTIVAAAKTAVASIRDEGLLILYISGHGGQTADTTGHDEPDGKDEMLCLWDGHLTDDAVWTLLSGVPRGIRVWMVTDTCHSGSNYRSPRSYRQPAASTGVSLLHWGGCGDGQYSYGSAQGGHFTTALVDGWKSGQSYAAWFSAAKRLTPKTQVPTCEVVGEFPVNLPAFR